MAGEKKAWSPEKVMIAAVCWNVFDVIVHIAVDMVEPLRISGNIVIFIAAAVIFSVPSQASSLKLSIVAAALGVGAHIGFNGGWVIEESPLPVSTLIPATVFITVSFSLGMKAMWRFLSALEKPFTDPTPEQTP